MGQENSRLLFSLKCQEMDLTALLQQSDLLVIGTLFGLPTVDSIAYES